MKTVSKKIKKVNNTDVDVLVIGSGIGGLVSAALLVKKGISVNLVEKNNHIGGYFSSFTEQNAVFDYAISYALSFNENDVADLLLKELNIKDKLKIKRLDKLDIYIFDQKRYEMSNSFEKFRQYLIENFDDEAENISAFFKWLSTLYQGIDGVKGNAIIISNFLKNYESFLKKYFTNQRLINILAMRIQADPASLLIMAGFINECLMGGMYYIKGGYGVLPLTLAETIKDNGGKISLDTKIHKITYIKENDVYQVQFDSGEIIRCKYIVSNISPMNLNALIDDSLKDCKSKMSRITDRRKIGHSSISVYLKVSRIDLSKWDNGRIYIVPDNADFDIFNYYHHIEAGEYNKEFLLKTHIPSVHDDSICGQDEHIIRVESDMCIDCFESMSKEELEEEKSEILKYVLEKLDKYIDHRISENVNYSKVLLPTDFRDIFGSDQGSGTGWAHTVDNYFKNVFPTKCCFPNSFIVGQWGQLGSGLRQLILSGRNAAEYIELKEKRI